MFLIIEEEESDIEPTPEEYLTQEYEQADDILKKLASLARSSQVRDLLLSLVDVMSEPLLPLTKIASPLVWKGQMNWKCDGTKNTASVELCKSHFWKKLEKMARRTYKALMKAKQVWDFLKEVEEKLQNEEIAKPLLRRGFENK